MTLERRAINTSSKHYQKRFEMVNDWLSIIRCLFICLSHACQAGKHVQAAKIAAKKFKSTVVYAHFFLSARPFSVTTLEAPFCQLVISYHAQFCTIGSLQVLSLVAYHCCVGDQELCLPGHRTAAASRFIIAFKSLRQHEKQGFFAHCGAIKHN